MLRKIASDDAMFGGSEQHYFSVGANALELVGRGLHSADMTKVRRVLDLPSGHGRVLRWLRAEFPDAETTACDLDVAGVEHCAEAFDAIGMASVPDPAAIPLKGMFDVIWCGSLLTHLDPPTWPAWLELFTFHLAPEGVLLFTTHGRKVERRIHQGLSDYGLGAEASSLLEDYQQQGHAYPDYRADSPGHGISLADWRSARLDSIHP